MNAILALHSAPTVGLESVLAMGQLQFKELRDSKASRQKRYRLCEYLYESNNNLKEYIDNIIKDIDCGLSLEERKSLFLYGDLFIQNKAQIILSSSYMHRNHSFYHQLFGFNNQNNDDIARFHARPKDFKFEIEPNKYETYPIDDIDHFRLLFKKFDVWHERIPYGTSLIEWLCNQSNAFELLDSKRIYSMIEQAII